MRLSTSQGELRQLPRDPCILPISAARFMHTAREYIGATLPVKFSGQAQYLIFDTGN